MTPPVALPGLRLVTINICGLTSYKLVKLVSWLREQHFDGAIVTETRIVDDPADLYRRHPGSGALWPGARFFHVPGTGSTGGVLAILGPHHTMTDIKPFSPPPPANHTGRILRLDLTISSRLVCLLALYAPAQSAARQPFFSSTITPFLPPPSTPLLIGGDFNCVLSLFDCVYVGSPHPHRTNRLSSAAILTSSLMDPYGLHDVWRDANPSSSDFTHFSAFHQSGARLDRWLANDPFLSFFPNTSSTILPSCGARTDHLPVSLSFLTPPPPNASLTGRGLSGFPLFLPNMPAAETEMRTFIEERLPSLTAGDPSSAVERWDSLKEEFRTRSWAIYRAHRKKRQESARKADSAAAAARADMIAADHPSPPSLHATWVATIDAAREAWKAITTTTINAAAILDHLFSNTSSYYFHSLAKVPKAPTIITAIHRPNRPPDSSLDTVTLSSPTDIGRALKYASSFFSSASPHGLFAPRPTDTAAQQTLLSSITRTLPPTYSRLAEGLDGDSLLTEEDFDLALASVQRGSVPGLDGLPYEFYRHYEDLLTPALLFVFNSAFRNSTSPCPLSLLLIGVICLFLKAGQPKEELSSYRPITLLNCDVKLVMYIIANRLNRPLDYVIDITQSAFLHGRDISDNVRYNLGLSSRLRELGIPAWLLDSDLSKAYDTTDRSFLLQVATRLGLHSRGVVRWMEILMAGSSSIVRINGFLSSSFPSANGLPQGSALSCFKWDIIFQAVISRLNSLHLNGRLLSFPLPLPLCPPRVLLPPPPPPPQPPIASPTTPLTPPPHGHPPHPPLPLAPLAAAALPPPAPPPYPHPQPPREILAPACTSYADDCRVVVLAPDTEGVCSVQQSFALCQQAGLPSQSIPKTVFFLLHHPSDTPLPESLNPSLHVHHPATGYRLAPHDAVIVSLGVPYASDPSAAVDAAFSTMAARMSASAARWLDLDPCLLGRVHAANQCLASKAVYQQSFLPPDPVRHLPSMQRAVARLVVSTKRIEEITPYPSALCPGQHVAFLPRHAGGLGLMDLSAASPAMLSKAIWQLFTYSSHPSRALLRHEVASCLLTLPPLPPSHPTYIPPGAHWVITSPTIVPARDCTTPSYQASLSAFRQLPITRVLLPEHQPLESILLELTFNNTAPGGRSTPISSMSSPMARSWLRLRAVHAAWLRHDQLNFQESDDLYTIIFNLPQPWFDAIITGDDDPPPPPIWSSISHPDDAIQLFLGPDPNFGTPASRSLWELWPSGRLHPYDGAFVAPDPAVSPPRPALVQHRPWSKHNWLRREHDFTLEQEELPPDARRELVEPWLVGIYDQMDLDPTVWGITFGPTESVSLLDIKVRHARRCFSHQNSLVRATHQATPLPGYTEHGAIWPAIWPLDTSPTAPLPATAPDSHLHLLGLAGLEERWRRTAIRRADLTRDRGDDSDVDDDPTVPNTPPSWLDLGPRPPRLSRAQRLALRGQLPAPALRQDFPKVWRPLRDPTIHPPFAVTCWRILHGTLGCNAFLSHVRQRRGRWDPAMASCSAPACGASLTPESITHAFFDCPEVQPVIAWFFDTWRDLSGINVPRLPSIFIADDPFLWPDRPTHAPLLRLWHFFRITALGVIWRNRCSRVGFSHRGSFARRTALDIVHATTSAISRDWTRTQSDVRTLDDGHFCTDWWRGFDARITISSFISTWASPEVFCRVDREPPNGPNDQDTRTLILRLSASSTAVPLPP